jgi:hypothetical protein
LINRDLHDRIRILELSIPRELADMHQRRHHGISNNPRKRMIPTGTHARRVMEIPGDLRRRRGDKSGLSLAQQKNGDDDEEIDEVVEVKEAKMSGAWQVASPEPPEVMGKSSTEPEPCTITTADNNNNNKTTLLTVDTLLTTTPEVIPPVPTSPSVRRDLSAIWRDLRAEKVIAIPAEDEGYNSCHSKEAIAKVTLTTTTATTTTTTNNNNISLSSPTKTITTTTTENSAAAPTLRRMLHRDNNNNNSNCGTLGDP